MEESDSQKPTLNVVKPDVKTALRGLETQQFVEVLDESPCESIKLTNVGFGIGFVDGVLSQSECQKICYLIDSCQSLSFWSASGRDNEEARMFRDADTVEVNCAAFADIIWRRVSHLLDSTSLTIDDDLSDPNWERELVGYWHPKTLNNDMLFARYPSFGSFAPHTDGRAIHDFNTRSFYSVIIFLNDIPTGQGGGTKFYEEIALKHLEKHVIGSCQQHWTASNEYMMKEVQPKAGRLLFFHQSLVHEGVPPMSPYQKYIIRSDIMMKRIPEICNEENDRVAYKLFKEAEDLAESGNVKDSIPLFAKAIKLSPTLARIMGQA